MGGNPSKIGSDYMFGFLGGFSWWRAGREQGIFLGRTAGSE